MTEEEHKIMHQHIAYWTDKQNQGIALVFGPVLNPKAPHGLAIIEVEDVEQVPQLVSEDPMNTPFLSSCCTARSP